MLASEIVKGIKLFHIPTGTWVSLCNCASVASHRKISWAKAHPSQYSKVDPNAPTA